MDTFHLWCIHPQRSSPLVCAWSYIPIWTLGIQAVVLVSCQKATYRT